MKTPDFTPKIVELDLGYVNRLLGVQLSAQEAKKLLEKMRHGVEIKENNKLKVLVPAYRTDILHPIDLVEDIAIAYGYQNFRPELPRLSTVGRKDPLEKYTDTIRELMIGYGFTEVMTLIMTSRNMIFTRMRLPESEVVEAEKPVSGEHAVCRNWLIPSLMSVLERNKNREYPQKIFEAGDVIYADGRQSRKLAGVVAHSKANYSDTKATVVGLLSNLGLKLDMKPFEHPSFIEGRCAQTEYGFFGEIHPEVLENFGLEVPVCAFEFDFDRLQGKQRS